MSGWTVDSVLRLTDREQDEGRDHSLSHYVMARKVLRQSPDFAIRIGRAFAHHKLTRDECEGLIEDFADEDTWPPPREEK